MDTQAPQLAGVPADATAECSAVPPAATTVTATDNCDAAPKRTVNEKRIDGACGGINKITRTWTATDNCGNSASASQVITVRDTQAPQLAGVPADATAECSAVPPAATTVTATDNCDASPSITFNEVRTDGPCADSYTLTRTWTATDNCGNSASASQVITVRDTQAPQLAGVPADATAECSAVPLAATTVTATDNCDASPSITFNEVRTDGPCADSYTLTRTWTATDNCGNSASASQVITVRDTQ